MNYSKLIQGNEQDNNRIVAEQFAEVIQQARHKANPTAEDILNSVELKRVVFK